MNTIFMNSRNSTASNPCRLLLNLSDKINLEWNDKYDALSNRRKNGNKRVIQKQ